MKNNDQYLHDLRHSAAHILAHAVLELFPNTLLTIGPVTENGFFYDFLPEKNFKDEDLVLIEQRMHEITLRGYSIIGKQVSKKNALALYEKNKFKQEIINQINDETVGIYYQGDFFDLCRGGHIEKLAEVKYFKLLSISGSYWRANRQGDALQRITGLCFATQKDLDSHLELLENIQKYDHRKLGKQLDLFSFHEYSPGIPLFHHKGLIIYNQLINHLKYLRNNTYQEIKTPMIMHESLWKISGHYDNYKEHMYLTEVEKTNFCIKPMNCPGSILLYKERPRSYKELPLRLAEFGYVHRYELSGVLHGLFRVRAFTQDDAHHYCTVDQILDEVQYLLGLIQKTYAKFNFPEIKLAISTRPEKYMGTIANWDKATEALKQALDIQGLPYTIQEGEGAFYGPKIEIKICDAMKREWQCGTIQVDFCQPANFKLEYIEATQSRNTPVMIHVAIYGSLERFIGILLEHYKGFLPFWLAPVQIRVLKITDAQNDYVTHIINQLCAIGIRAEGDTSGDQIGAQIRHAQHDDKIPLMIIIGKKEVETNSITLRHSDGRQEQGIPLQQLIDHINTLTSY